MEWLNLHTSTLDSPQFVGAEPAERATWLCLLRYCVGQENGGRIALCRGWNDRRWQQLCRVMKREVIGPSDLWEWDGDDLVVWAYPVNKEEEVKRNRSNGAKGGRPAGSAKTNLVPFPSAIPQETTRFLSGSVDGSTSAETERKGREGKGIGKEEEGEANPVAGKPAGSRATASRPESQAQVEAYFLELGSTSLESETFFDHYEANGWRQGGKTPMRDWRAAARNWVRRNGSAPRGGAAGLAGSDGAKNLSSGGGRRGGVNQTQEEPRVSLPVAGLDEAMAEGEKGGAA